MVGAHRLECPRCLPSQQLGGIGCRRIISVDVTGAPWFDIASYAPSAGLLKRPDNFEDAASGACAQIDGKAFGTIQQSQRRDVSCGQVHDVNVVTDAGSVGGIVIITTYVKPVVAPNRDLGNKRDKVVGNPDWIFANQAAFVGAG